jgi:hypothetical protein
MACGQLTTAQVTGFALGWALSHGPASKGGFMKVTASCAACGSEKLRIPDDNDPDQMVRCASCNAEIGKKQDIRRKLAEAGKKEMKKLIKNAFSKNKFFKP